MEIVVILLPPTLDLSPRIVQASKHMFIQTLISEPRVEGFDEGILVWLSWRDKIVNDARCFDPRSERVRLKLRAVVCSDTVGSNTKAL